MADPNAIANMEKADAARARFQAQQNAIASDPTLSAQGRKDKTDRARDDANAEIDKLEQAAKAAAVAERTLLEQRLLAVPAGASSSDRMSYRDAFGRASICDDGGELLALLRLSMLSGDALLSRAALLVAMQRNDVDVINAYEEANPKLAADVERLWALTWNAAPKLDATMFA